jgi:hypothetical protein
MAMKNMQKRSAIADVLENLTKLRGLKSVSADLDRTALLGFFISNSTHHNPFDEAIARCLTSTN